MKMRLSELEEAVILMVGILGNEAYPAMISEEFRKRTFRTLTVGIVHSVLDRLQNFGFLDSTVTESGDGALKRKKRIYSISSYGREENDIPILAETLEDILLLYHASDNKTTRSLQHQTTFRY